jgi:uncharacterized protein (TIGR00299 family) protein
MRVIYLDCFSGLSGDMTLAALVDAGADKEYIEQDLAKLNIEPFSLQWRRVQKNGISALKLDVLPDPKQPPKQHRHYSDIARHIAESGISARAQQLAQAIFQKIAAAEAKIHGISVEKVHFHEVGAIDSIVDVVGIALAIDSLEIERVISAPVPLGSGTVRCDHGIYPVPAPATLEMMRGLQVAPSNHRVELTTPTGAGVVSALVNDFSAGMPSMVIDAIGYGAGTRDLPNQPNVLRVVVGSIESYLPVWPAHHEIVGHIHEHTQTHDYPHTHDHSHQDNHLHTHDHTHDHSDEQEHDHTHEHSHDHSHGHEHLHNHAHEHSHNHHEHGHDHEHSHPQHEQKNNDTH